MGNVAVRSARVAVLGSILIISSAGVAEPRPTYSIAAIEYAPSLQQQVGKVQAGLLCLPKGKLRWRDVAQPEHNALVGQVEKTLGAGGMAVAPQPDPLYGDPPPVTQYRIRISVEAVALKICTAGDVMFIGKVGRAPNTQGTITVRWETFDRVVRVRISDQQFVIPINNRDADARTASRVLNGAIVESASRYALALRSGD